VRNNFNMFVHSFSRRPLNYSRGILEFSNRQLIYNGKMPKFNRRRKNLDKQQLSSSKKVLSYIVSDKVCR
jgi:hypothetical protein